MIGGRHNIDPWKERKRGWSESRDSYRAYITGKVTLLLQVEPSNHLSNHEINYKLKIFSITATFSGEKCSYSIDIPLHCTLNINWGKERGMDTAVKIRHGVKSRTTNVRERKGRKGGRICIDFLMIREKNKKRKCELHMKNIHNDNDTWRKGCWMCMW